LLLECQTGKYGPGDSEESFLTDMVDFGTMIVDDIEDGALALDDLDSSAKSLKWNPFWAPWFTDNQIFYDNEANDGYVKCVGGEDPTCSDRFNVLACNIGDHLSYLNVTMGLCRIGEKFLYWW